MENETVRTDLSNYNIDNMVGEIDEDIKKGLEDFEQAVSNDPELVNAVENRPVDSKDIKYIEDMLDMMDMSYRRQNQEATDMAMAKIIEFTGACVSYENDPAKNETCTAALLGINQSGEFYDNLSKANKDAIDEVIRISTNKLGIDITGDKNAEIISGLEETSGKAI